VLRAAKEGYRLVGEAYLHNFMDGEGVGRLRRVVRLI
jgi:hypothetical protein